MGYGPCHSLLREAMKTLIAALFTAITLVISLLGPAPVRALSSPPINLAAPPSVGVVFMTKKMDAQAKKVEGRLQSAAGDLTGNNTNKIKGAAKQVQGSAMNTAASMEKGAKATGKSVGESARGFGDRIADKLS